MNTIAKPRFHVLGTEHEDREFSPTDFVLTVAPATVVAKGLQGAELVVIEHVLVDGNAKGAPPMRAIAALRVDQGLQGTAAGPAQIRLDQTLRTALGIRYRKDTIKADWPDATIVPVVVKAREKLHERVRRVMGVRYTYARVEKAHPNDIERNICRVSKDTLSVIGTDESREIVISAAKGAPGDIEYVQHRVRAFDVSKDVQEARAKIKEADAAEGWGARYVDSPVLLGMRPDLTPIYLDEYSRGVLGVAPGQAVRLRRSLSDLYLSQAFEFGVMTALSAPIARLVPDHAWIAVAVSLLIALLVVVVKVRSRVSGLFSR